MMALVAKLQSAGMNFVASKLQIAEMKSLVAKLQIAGMKSLASKLQIAGKPQAANLSNSGHRGVGQIAIEGKALSLRL